MELFRGEVKGKSMIYLKRYIIVISLFGVLFSCGKKPKEIPAFTVSKEFKTDSVTTVNVHIANRMKLSQLALIAGKVKADSASIKNLEVHYLLPGNSEIAAGDNSYYASAKVLKESDIKPTDTLKDDNGTVFRIRLFGLDSMKAQKLLTLQPKEIENKSVLGRFIDDYNHTVIIPFKDTLDKKGNLYIIELDSTAKVVSATMSLKEISGNDEKWMVTQSGDYITIKNNVLSQFAADGLGLPFNSIKSGI
jgi:hypothetical protein